MSDIALANGIDPRLTAAMPAKSNVPPREVAQIRAVAEDFEAFFAGLVFDDTIEPPFGWQGTFDENTYANLALVRILGQMERAGLPTVLVYDEGTETKPLFPELAALFTHQVRKDPETEAPEIEARVARVLRLA